MLVTLQYDGGGWTFPYLAGITKRLLEEKPKHVEFLFTGVSSGSCIALAAALDIPMDDLIHLSLSWSKWCRYFPLLTIIAVNRIFNKLLDKIDLKKVNNVFAVGVSRFDPKTWQFNKIIFSNFESTKQLQKLLCDTCRLPFVNALPWFTGSSYFDGGLSGRFFSPPWESDYVVKLSTCSTRNEANFVCKLQVPKYRAIIPYDAKNMYKLYNTGYQDGKEILESILKPNINIKQT